MESRHPSSNAATGDGAPAAGMAAGTDPARVPARRLARLTWLTFLGLVFTTSIIAFLAGELLTERIRNSYVEIQTTTSIDQAERIAGLLEQELKAGIPPATVRQHLQESLSRSPYDEAGFLCLLDGDATVICHPDARAVGMRLSISPAEESDWPGAERLTGQAYAGDVHLVVRRPVAGTPWQVSVHTNYNVIEERVDALLHQIRMAGLPMLAGIILFGTLAARLAGRSYERRIENANSALEARVAERTVALRSASTYYREVIEAAPSAIFLADAGRHIKLANTRAQALTGLTAEALSALSIDDVITWKSPPARGAHQLPADGPKFIDAELTRTDGAVRQLQVYTCLLTQPHIREEMLIAHDVTELRTLEREFLHAQKMDAVGQLAAGVAHDFNNMLGAIMGFAEVARIEHPEGPEPGPVSQILATTERAARLTSQLLMFSRKQPVRPVVTALPGLLGEMLPIIERVAGRGVTVAVGLDPATWTVRVDPLHLEQALLNLAINARDAMEGRGRIFIRSFNVPLGTAARLPGGWQPRADCVCLEIEDTGPGIPPEVQSRIFEPFFTTKAAGKGTGLGLASVQSIMQQLGGHIALRSEPGGGACFSLFFPRVKAAVESRHTAGASVIRGQGERILVVEDDELLLNSICSQLTAAGYRCTGALSRERALKALAPAGSHDLILSDISMPGMDLHEFVATVGTLAPGMPVVLTTAFAAPEVLQEVRAAGLSVLSKPFSLDRLASVINENLATAYQL